MTPVIITAEIAGALIVLAVLVLAAAAHEWIAVSVSASVRFIPASKRTPRATPGTPAGNLLPGTAQQDGQKPERSPA